MILGGGILLVIGAVVALMVFLSNTDIFSNITKYGFGEWIARFFDVQYLTSQKIVFYVALVVAIVGVVLWLIGRAKEKKGNYKDERAAKVAKYFRGLLGEAKKIVWPDRKTVVRNTFVTIVVCLLLGAVIFLVDFGLYELIMLL